MGKIKKISIATGYIDGYLWRIRILVNDKTETIQFPQFEMRNQIESSGKYYNQNREKILEKKHIKDETEEQKKKLKNWNRLYRLCHLDKDKIYRKKNSNKYRIWDGRHRNKRKGLGFIPLNAPLDDISCDAHHINNNDIIYIPTIIHQRISHNLKTNKNMTLINSIAEGFK